ncbi:hypothetical protein ACO0QE_000621 [Hanseniaspora vineae]
MGYRDSYYNSVHYRTPKQVLYVDWQQDVFPTPDQLCNSNNNVYRNGAGVLDSDKSSVKNGTGANSYGIVNPAMMATAEDELMTANGMINLGTINQFWDHFHDEENFRFFQMCSVGPDGSILFNKSTLFDQNHNSNTLKFGVLDLPKVRTSEKSKFYKGLKPGAIGSVCDGKIDEEVDINTMGLAESKLTNEILGDTKTDHAQNMQDRLLKSELLSSYEEHENEELNNNNYKIYNLPRKKVMNHDLWPEYGLERFLVKLIHMKQLNSTRAAGNWDGKTFMESDQNQAMRNEQLDSSDPARDFFLLNILNDGNVALNEPGQLETVGEDDSNSTDRQNYFKILQQIESRSSNKTLSNPDNITFQSMLNLSNNYRNTDPFEAVFYDGRL